MKPLNQPPGPADSRFNHADDPAHRDLLLAYSDSVATLEPIRQLRALAQERLSLHPGEVVLDLGCGLGEVTALMAGHVQPGGQVHGVDLVARFLEEAQARHGHLPGIQFHCATAEALPLGAGSVDAVYAERIFQHLLDPECVLQELARVLKPGGRCLILDPDWSTLQLEHPDLATTQQVQRAWSTAIRNPDLIASLADWAGTLPEWRCTGSEPFDFVLSHRDDLERMLPARRSAEIAVTQGLSKEQAEAWLAAYPKGANRMYFRFGLVSLQRLAKEECP